MSIKSVTSDNDLFFVDSKEEITIDVKGKKVKFYANAISYFDNYNIGVQPKSKNQLAMLVAASITDKDGNKFTYDEVLRLKDDVARPFFEAALKVNSRVQKEKKGATKKK